MDHHPFNSQASMNDDDAEEAHLQQLQRQLVAPSPLQPVHHDLQRGPASVSSTPNLDRVLDNVVGTPLSRSIPSVPSFHNPPSVQNPMTPMTPMSHSALDSGIVPTLQNIVSTVNLGCKLDLKKIALHARNAEYNPKRFAAVIMRIRDPRTTALIFSSGKMVCTGAKSEDQSRLAARKYARIVQKLGFEVSINNHDGTIE